MLHLADATEFYRREAAIALEVVDYVEARDESQYLLKGGFEGFFFLHLPSILPFLPTEPVNALAKALFILARSWAYILYEHPGSWTVLDPDVLKEWKKSWEKISEKDLEEFRRRDSTPHSEKAYRTAVDASGKVDDKSCRDPGARRIELEIAFEQNTNYPPEMRITVRGEPAVNFMIAYIRKLQGVSLTSDDGIILDNLHAMFDSVTQAVARKFLGLIRSRGRPRTISERAALLMYHERKPIGLVARELCTKRTDPAHRCDTACKHGIKKVAKSHFLNLRREVRSIVRSGEKIRHSIFSDFPLE